MGHPDLVPHERRISAIYKTGIDLATGYVVKRLAHVLGQDQLALQGVPVAAGLQRAFGVAAHRHAVRVAHGYAPDRVATQGVQRVQHKGGSDRLDQHQRVLHKGLAAALGHQPGLFCPVHGVFIGTGKDINRRAFFNLLEQGAGRAKIHLNRVARVGRFKPGGDFLECVRQAGRRRHRNGLCIGAVRRPQQRHGRHRARKKRDMLLHGKAPDPGLRHDWRELVIYQQT